MNFEYYITKQVNGDIEIEDTGNCAIQAFNDKGEEYYLIIDTSLGTTRVFQYGPAVPDFDLLPKSVNCSFKRIEYSDYKVHKVIDDFLNNGYAGITQAFLIDKESALNNCRDIIEYMRQDILY